MDIINKAFVVPPKLGMRYHVLSREEKRLVTLLKLKIKYAWSVPSLLHPLK